MRSCVGLVVLALASLGGCGGRSSGGPGVVDGDAGARDGGSGALDGGRRDGADGGAHAGDGGAGVCRFGQDQTCNDDPVVSAVWGACNADGTCRCHAGFMVNPQTGKCRPAGDGGAAVCTPGEDETCADGEFVPTTAIHCSADGTCSCSSGEYFLNPSTGKCRWGTCDMLAQDCPDAGDGCFPPNPNDAALTPHCGRTGTTPDGSPCSSDHDCREGSTCQMFTSATMACYKMCDVQAGLGCPAGQTCSFLWARAGMPGLCR
jgi:hypothetical protein